MSESLTIPADTIEDDREAASRAPCSASVIRLTLQTFRSYDYLDIRSEAAPMVLTGPNGAGKTNILEALSLLSPGRGLRGASLGEMQYIPSPACGGGLGWGNAADSITHDSPHPASPRKRGEGQFSYLPEGSSHRHGWQVAARLQQASGEEVQLGTARQNSDGVDKRVVHIDGEAHKSPQKLAEYAMVLWLTPPMEHLFIGPAAERRKFFDRLTYGFTSTHGTAVNRFEQAMRERNKLLQSGYADPAWLSAIERKMAENAVAIAAARVDAAEKINGALQLAEESGFPKGWVELEGQVEALAIVESALEAEQRYAELLAQNRPEDARAGRTLIGPHRTDMQVTYAAKKQPAKHCSTGEQKALMLSLVLAVARARQAWQGMGPQPAPLLLLDEVVAHLDPDRRLQLFDAIAALGMQAWMTGVEPSCFAGLKGRAQFLRVEGGKVFLSE